MTTRIAITTLSLTDFRNYESLRLELTPEPVVLTGHNGAGKTNLLEAVSLLIPGRGLRRAKLSELDRQSTDASFPWIISANVESAFGLVQIGTKRDIGAGEETDKRIVRIEGKSLRSQAELAEYVSVSWLTPVMDQLFNDGNAARRRFLDRLVYAFDPVHASRVNAYEYAMRERNRLLLERKADADWLTSLEWQMAEIGTAIAIARMSACDQMNEEMQRSELSFPKAWLKLEGEVENHIALGQKAVAVESLFADMLRASRPQDAAAGRALTGVHRSTLTVRHCIKNMEAGRCSTGEQKALLLSIVLAEARASAHWHRKIPILLLDEVVAHLDPRKRGELFEEILATRAQVWMTGTDAALFDGLQKKAQFFEASGGIVKACSFEECSSA